MVVVAGQAAFPGFGGGMATGAKLARNLFEITGKGRRVPVLERIKVLGVLIKSMAGQTAFVVKQAEMRRVRKDGERMFAGRPSAFSNFIGFNSHPPGVIDRFRYHAPATTGMDT